MKLKQTFCRHKYKTIYITRVKQYSFDGMKYEETRTREETYCVKCGKDDLKKSRDLSVELREIKE